MTNQHSNPTVAVVVPCYNGAADLSTTLNSLMSQTYRPDEIIVVDDGSQDASVSVAESFGPPVRVVRQANAGAAKARFTGVQEAKSDIIVFNDAGDVSLPNRVENLRRALIAHPECVASYSTTWIKSRPRPINSRITGRPFDGTITVISDPLERMLGQSWPLAIGMNLAVRRSVAIESAAVSKFYKAANDYALQISTACYGPFANVAEVTMEYEETEGGISSSNGYIQQTGYALCAAIEHFELESRRRPLDRSEFGSRVERDWPGIALHMYLRRNYPVLKRVTIGGLKYGRWRTIPKTLWWALDTALVAKKLESAFFLKTIAQSLAFLRRPT